MFSAAIEKVVNKWTDMGVLEDGDKDIYIYGLDLLLFTIINISVVTMTALVFNRLNETLMLLAVVLPLQSVAGGYHAETHLRCFLIMFIGWFAVMPLLSIVTPITATIMVCISFVAICILAPVPHVNVPMVEKRRQKMRRISILIALLWLCLSLLLLWGDTSYVYSGIVFAMGLGIIAFSMLCARVKHCFSKANN